MGIQEAKGKFLVVLYTDYDEWWRLGEYKTKERALEVLDEIQDFIENDGAYDKVVDYEINEYTSKVHYEQRKIYEMPQK